MKMNRTAFTTSKQFTLMFVLLLLLQLALLAVAAVQNITQAYQLHFAVNTLLGMGLLIYAAKNEVPFEIPISISVLLSSATLLHTLLSEQLEGYRGNANTFLLHAVIGIMVFAMMTRLLHNDNKIVSFFQTNKGIKVLMPITLVLYGLCFFSSAIGGAHNWVTLGGFSMQPTELCKFIYLWTLGILLNGEDIEKNGKLLIGTYLLHAAGLVIVSEFGFLILITLVTFIVLAFRVDNWQAFVKGLWSFRHKKAVIFLAMVFILLAMVVLFFNWDKIHPAADAALQKITDRLTIFFNPEADPYGNGYQYLMAESGVFNGGLLGSNGIHTLVPICESDMIFSMLVESFGFMIGALILVVYLILALSGTRFALEKHDYLSLVMTTAIWVQAIYNIGCAIGVMPLSGVTLPLISAGGTSLLVTFMMFSVIFSRSSHSDYPLCTDEGGKKDEEK